MRPEPNNEIDLLLRQLSRRNRAPVSEIDEQHLDADELNSYVANALPAATRARYTAHLADCSSCRKLVVELGAVQGPVTVQASGPAVAPSRLMGFLTSLFSPMVLRYAVPALGLMVIAVIGVVVLRKEGRDAPIARSESPAGQVTNAPQESPGSGYIALDSNSRGRTEEGKQQPAAPAANEGQRAKAAPITKEAAPVVANQPGAPSGAVAAEPPPVPKAVRAEEDTARIAKRQEDQKKAEAPQPAAGRDANKEREADKNEPAKQKTDSVATVTVAPSSIARKDIAVRPSKSPDTAGAGAAAGQELKPTGKLQTQSRGEGRAEANDAAAETRSVAGRRFRKSGRVWIDTAFDSSKPIISVTRGSEHYRSLIGDEPSLRKIADELDGEIIVVWKVSTYRIR
jgi:hypothetical protein